MHSLSPKFALITICALTSSIFSVPVVSNNPRDLPWNVKNDILQNLPDNGVDRMLFFQQFVLSLPQRRAFLVLQRYNFFKLYEEAGYFNLELQLNYFEEDIIENLKLLVPHIKSIKASGEAFIKISPIMKFAKIRKVSIFNQNFEVLANEVCLALSKYQFLNELSLEISGVLESKECSDLFGKNRYFEKISIDDLVSKNIEPGLVENIRGQKYLRKLETNVFGFGMSLVSASMVNMRSLKLYDEGIFQSESSASYLESVYEGFTETIKTFEGLEELALTGSRIVGEIRQFAKILDATGPKLQVFEMHQVQIGKHSAEEVDAFLEVLSTKTNLEILKLNHASLGQILHKLIGSVSQLRNLKSLDLQNSQIHFGGIETVIEYLKQLITSNPGLKEVVLYGNRLFRERVYESIGIPLSHPLKLKMEMDPSVYRDASCSFLDLDQDFEFSRRRK
jgi:hypothetical protein